MTSAYHPQSNGLDERFDRTLKSQLQKLVNDRQDDWDDLLDNILFAYRTSHQESTKSAHDADALDGDAHDGDAHDRDALDGDAHDGDALDGDAHDGDALDGDAHDRDAHDGDAIDVDTCNGGSWTRIRDVSLTEVDKELLTEKWLNDKLIHAAQLLLKQKEVSSLQNPLFGQTLSFAPVRDDFVQILHSESHWVTLSTIGTQHPTVCVYDSLYMSLPASTKVQISALLQTEEKLIKLEWANVQKQPNGSDCGLFAIAFATALCHGQMPEERFFDAPQLRQHLHDCIDKDHMDPFLARRRKCQKKTKKMQVIDVYCHCRLATKVEEKMVMCVGCHEWYHEQCEVIPITHGLILI